MTEPATIIREYVLESMEREPLAKRVELLRALAAVAPDGAEIRCLTEMASALAGVQQRHQQLLLNFKRRSTGAGQGRARG